MPTVYFAQHPVFRHDEFVEVHAVQGGRSPQTSAAVLRQHVASGNLLHIRRGLYATVPRGVDPRRVHVDPYLLASKLAEDAVIAHHAALQFHGRSCSVWRRYHFLTHSRRQRFVFRDLEFVPVQAPMSVRELPQMGGGVVEHRHAGGMARVATLERTLVDVLDAPERSGGWEEVWRSLETIELFDLDAVIDYTRALDTALTAARVGFFLERHREPLMVEERHLEAFEALAPRQARYLDTNREPGKLVGRWNLIVPDRFLDGPQQETG